MNVLRKAAVGLLQVILVKPIAFIARLVFRALMPIYRLSFNAKHRSKSIIAGSVRPGLLGYLTSNYVVHAAVVLLTLSVATGNLTARGAGLNDVAAKSVLEKTISGNLEDQDVIERAPAPKVAYLSRRNVLSTEAILEAETGSDSDANAVSATGNALQVPLLTGGDIQQRSDVTTYIVQGGDTIGGIANRFGITQKTILSANNMSDADFIKPGQELTIPPITGVLHKIKKGDTIASISQKYKVDAQEILDYNHLADPSAISVDQTLIVPGGEIPELAPQRPEFAQPTPGRGFAGPIPGPAPAIGGGKLNWPTSGRKINQYFRYGHTGIDVECNYSNPIYAARAGTVSAVIYVRYGYGYHIIINHGGSLQTLYGHNSKIFVKPGQRVAQGQSIAMCGSTGRSTGTHVHFETIVNGRKVNPLTYL